MLSGLKAKELGIIPFQASPNVFMPVNMIKGGQKAAMQDILSAFPENFSGLGTLRGHPVNLQMADDVKPVAEVPRRIPYHLKSRVEEGIQRMMRDGVIEEHPNREPAPWVSNIVIAPKDDGDIRITLDAKNVNKGLKASNYPIPRQEDIKARLTGKKLFSKLDLKSAYWQLEIDESSRKYTVFHACDKLYRYKRLVMGLKCSQGELNAALQPIFASIKSAHVIHDDVIVATDTAEEHLAALKEVMAALSAAGLTLNPDKCVFGSTEIKFWGMMVTDTGIRPDPEKVEALKFLTPPKNKEEVNSFICMMQANADFIPGFARKCATLRELTKKNAHFVWLPKHQACFEELIEAFKDDTLLAYFDTSKPTFVLVDAHRTGLGAILAQGNSIVDARPVAIASRATNPAEKNYPQLDLETLAIDFGLLRFRDYLVGSPTTIHVLTDHKPLVSIFANRRKGSIRAQRVKLHHQDIPYKVLHCKGSRNAADYLSRHAKPFNSLTEEEKAESEELTSLLYMLHTTPVTDHITLATISAETAKDPTLKKVVEYIRSGRRMSGKEDPEVLKFEKFRD